jgi:hypothetical protein
VLKSIMDRVNQIDAEAEQQEKGEKPIWEI